MKKILTPRRIKVILIVILAAILVFALFKIGEMLESENNVFESESSQILEYNGKKYVPNNNLYTVMLLGIDETGEISDSGSYRNKGAADFIALGVFNSKTKKVTVLHLNRDTMTDVNMIGLGGVSAGSSVMQLAVSHSYGTGKEDSCINTKKAVSKLLSGITIDNFISLNMDGIAIVNDFVGGVPVEIKDDFSELDPSFVKGEEILLTGNMALKFVRARKGVSDQTNISRMSRQKEYMFSFYDRLKKTFSDESVSETELFDKTENYMVTDLSTASVSSLKDKINTYSFTDVVSIEGESKINKEVMEFYPDEDSLLKTVIDIFYTEQ